MSWCVGTKLFSTHWSRKYFLLTQSQISHAWDLFFNCSCFSNIVWFGFSYLLSEFLRSKFIIWKVIHEIHTFGQNRNFKKNNSYLVHFRQEMKNWCYFIWKRKLSILYIWNFVNPFCNESKVLKFLEFVYTWSQKSLEKRNLKNHTWGNFPHPLNEVQQTKVNLKHQNLKDYIKNFFPIFKLWDLKSQQYLNIYFFFNVILKSKI